MKIDKRLKRGLADLSSFFSGEINITLKKQERTFLTIEPPLDSSDDFLPPRLVFTSFLSASEVLEPEELIQLADLLRAAFPEVCLLSLSPSRSRYEAYAQVAPVPAWEEITGNPKVSLHPIRDGISFAYVSRSQFHELVKPEIILSHAYQTTGLRTALIIFDSVLGQNFSPLSFNVSHANTLELIDHCVFIVQPDLNQLGKTYELIRSCLARNQALQCSIFIAGAGAKSLWEVVYERFNVITSQFLASNLGFLGWAEGNEIQLNPELLMDERKNPAQLPFKASLSELFCLPILKG
ncbi:MAG: hypothetical protein A3C35_06690 [Omnitrophica bacterium RIFCSPHIGHO2_02_FULL_46_11]|nr:MAG: hypothetical protein A3C35_06690 [Omnitrophica bacterium RIFCSPHIGHO2_02_FULL_46_11]OGW86721.1 MAG: hypothetical protein A3A81_08590 [Omnitrophica bacterium RIFCSPLOWO2_01_FULL_45_10b]